LVGVDVDAGVQRSADLDVSDKIKNRSLPDDGVETMQMLGAFRRYLKKKRDRHFSSGLEVVEILCCQPKRELGYVSSTCGMLLL